MTIAAAFLVGLTTGLFPFALAEATALAAGAIASPFARLGVLVAFSAGHVLGKMVWYTAGRAEQWIRNPRMRAHIEKAKVAAAEHPSASIGVIASSATLSLPPFHLLTLAAGIVKAPPLRFALVAFVGRLIRFGAIAAFPRLFAL